MDNTNSFLQDISSDDEISQERINEFCEEHVDFLPVNILAMKLVIVH